MPGERSPRWGIPVSIGVHLLIVVLLVLASVVASRDIIPAMLGAGGPGPAGGGGGGTKGLGAHERLRYIDVSPAPPEPSTVAPKALPPPQPKVQLKPVRPRVEQPNPVLPDPVKPTLEVRVQAPPLPRRFAATTGAGGGTGTDGTNGSGPGTGGGVGTGAGTGRGSATGPGTGGGEGTIYPPTPDFLLIPPLPRPDELKGKTITVTFFIDAQGKPQRIEFESTGNGGYDRRLRDKFAEFRFRPAHRMDGTPVPSRYVTEVHL
jgi:protein TonB